MGKRWKMSKKEGPKTMLEMTAAKFLAFCIPDDIDSVKFWKNWFWGHFPCISVENMGLWVKSGWYGRSGLVVRSSARNPKLQVRSHLPPLWDPTSVLVSGAPSGVYFSPSSPFWKWEIVDILEFNNKWQSNVIFCKFCGFSTWCNNLTCWCTNFQFW